MRTWTFLDKLQRTVAKIGGVHLTMLYWTITGHRQSRARAIILNSDKTKVLLVKNITRKEFHLPGGGIEKGEDGQTAIIREVKEELGIGITILYQLGKYKYQKSNKHVEIFVTQTDTDNFKMQWELDDAQWFPFTQLPPLMKTAKQTLRDFLAHNEPVVSVWGLHD